MAWRGCTGQEAQHESGIFRNRVFGIERPGAAPGVGRVSAMGAYALRRLLALVPTLLFASVIVFAIVRMVPGDVVDLMLSQNDISADSKSRDGLVRALVWTSRCGGSTCTGSAISCCTGTSATRCGKASR